VWQQGIVQKVVNFVAEVCLDDNVVVFVPVTDLLVTHKPVDVAKEKMSKELRRKNVLFCVLFC
jgi:hypothetical protein